MAVIRTTFKLRRGLSADWTSVNPMLAAGEPGFESDTNRLKIGNGTNTWNELPYLGEDIYITCATLGDLPSLGEPNTFYEIEATGAIYKWVFNESTKQYGYLLFSSENSTGEIADIDLITGGNANG